MRFARTSQAAPAAADPLAEFYDQQVDWYQCQEPPPPDPSEQPDDGIIFDPWAGQWKNMECALVTVPVNYRAPDEGSLRIDVSRIKATDTTRRKGVNRSVTATIRMIAASCRSSKWSAAAAPDVVGHGVGLAGLLGAFDAGVHAGAVPVDLAGPQVDQFQQLLRTQPQAVNPCLWSDLTHALSQRSITRCF